MALSSFNSLAEMLEPQLVTAVRATVQTSTQSIEQTMGGCQMSETQKLEEFLKMKAMVTADGRVDGGSPSASTSGSSSHHREDMVEYDWVTVNDSDGTEIDYSCYLLLPGGSCFGPRMPPTGSPRHRSAHAERAALSQMQQNAAEVALMNCIFDECPTRKITPDFIKDATGYAESSTSAASRSFPLRLLSPRDQDGLDGYRYTLEYMLDKSMMQYQELMDVVQLVTWSGYLASLRRNGCCRQDVLDHCASVKWDDSFRSELSMFVMDREEESPGFVEEELRRSEEEMLSWRLKGRELRFPYEKRRICIMALDQYQYGGGSESMYPMDQDSQHC